MTKADLVERVANEAEMTKKDAEQLVEIVFDSIIDSLNNGEKVINSVGLEVSVFANEIPEKGVIRKRVPPSIFQPSVLPISSLEKN